MDVKHGYFEMKVHTLEKALQDAVKDNQASRAKASEFIASIKKTIFHVTKFIHDDILEQHDLNLKNIASEMQRVSNCMESINSLKNQLSQSITPYRDEGKPMYREIRLALEITMNKVNGKCPKYANEKSDQRYFTEGGFIVTSDYVVIHDRISDALKGFCTMKKSMRSPIDFWGQGDQSDVEYNNSQDDYF